MDSITHIALGACMGEAMLGKQVGKKALFWGALAHSFPDIDVVSALWLDTPSALLAHRGITHSIFGAFITVIILSLIATKIYKGKKVRPAKWMLFFTIAVFAHIVLDAFNSYGVGWFEPFNQYRVAFNAVYVADPIFSVVPVFAAIALLVIHRKSIMRKIWWRVSFIVTGIYLASSLGNKAVVDHHVKAALSRQDIIYSTYFSTPAPFQNLLWYIVAQNDSGYYIGYRSVFDKGKEMAFRFFPRNQQLLSGYANQKEIEQLTRFSQGYYVVQQWNDTLVFNDLRFGQIAGWYDPSARFTFHYFLGDSLNNKMVMQRGRLAGWNKQAIRSFFNRIAGNRQ
jgi:inner membrane protein